MTWGTRATSALSWVRVVGFLGACSSGCQAINDSSEFVIVRLSPDAGSGGSPALASNDCRNEGERERCVGDVPESCSESGLWEAAGEPCVFGCQPGACNQCEPGSRACSVQSSVPRECSALGRWVNLTPCELERPICSGGACFECAPGRLRCSPEGTPQTCGEGGAWRNEAACPERQVCIPETGRCGQCSEGDKRFCIREVGNCALGEQVCRADSSWTPCSIQPREDTCEPGDDGNCDGTPNTPSTGGCPCDADVACGPNMAVGICRPGVSACVDGTATPCMGAIGRAERDCGSPLDNDCDGVADDALDDTCQCAPGAVELCADSSYPDVGHCRASRRTCLTRANSLSSYWGECSGGVAPAGLDCTSLEDNDCDGSPDAQSESCECPVGTSMPCGTSRCSGTQTCVLSTDGAATFWSACEPRIDWAFEAPERITGLGLDGDLWAPALFDEGRGLVLGAGAPENIFVAARSATGAEFSAAASLDSINTPAAEGTPFVSTDRSTLYFYSSRSGGVGSRDIWFASTSTLAGWSLPALLPGVNTTADEQNPWVSPDELFIVFDSNRPGSAGDSDLWLARRATPGSDFGAPVNMGELNTGASEEGATLTRDGSTIFFASSRPGGGGGGLDIWFAARRDPNGTFSTPRPLTSLNASGLDLDLALSPDGDELFFSSQREGGVQQIYRAVRTCD